MKSYLEIGKIVTLHGLRGDVKVQPWCDDAEFLCEFPVLYLGKEKKEVEVSHARPQKNMVLLHLEGYDTPEQAETLRNQILYLNREDVELEEGDKQKIDKILMDIENIVSKAIAPKEENKKICKNCAFYDLCYI